MDDAWAPGIRLFNEKRYFECHEALELVWGPARGPDRLFLQGVIHLAVAFYHCERGNRLGAGRQLRKGLAKIAGYLPEYGRIDTGRLYREALGCLEQIQAGAAVTTFPRIHRRETAETL